MKKEIIKKGLALFLSTLFALTTFATSYAQDSGVAFSITNDSFTGTINIDDAAIDSMEKIEFIDESKALPLVEANEDDLKEIETNGKIDITGINTEKYTLDSIEDLSSNDNFISPMSVNTPPVAGLNYIIANPNSLLNGQITTNTIIYWLWEDDQYLYTYDPDGDEIDQYLIDGINEFVFSYVYIDNKIVGFATQITTAAQYQFLYQVVDSQGAPSNTVELMINVEPADGNSRPKASVTASPSNPTTSQNVTFNWANSFDPDGDALSSVRVRVYSPNGEYQNITSSSPYYVGMVSNGIVLKFSAAGTYQIWTSLSDTKNAWSNWAISTITASKPVTYQFRDVKINSDDPNNSKLTGFDWGDYAKSIELAKISDYPQSIYDTITIKSVPSHLQNKTFIETNWSVSGYVESNTGTPLSNATVYITIPTVGNLYFQKTVKTNTSGYFNYNCNSNEWWQQLNVNNNGDLFVGYITEWCRYGNYNTTSFKIASNMYIECANVSTAKTLPIVCTVGSCLRQIIGNKWIFNSSYNEWEYIQ